MSFAVTKYLLFGVELLWPIYATLVAMRTTSKSDDNQWLAYWVVHACMSVLEGVAHAVVQWVPLYFELKLVFVLWMTLPQTQGARMIYEDILAPRLAAWESRLRGGPAGAGGAAAAAAKAGSEREEPAGANAAAALQDSEDRGEGGSSKVKASLRNLFHRTHKSEGAEEAGGVRGSSGGGGGGGGGGITAVWEGQEVGGGGGGGVRHYSPLSAHLQQS